MVFTNFVRDLREVDADPNSSPTYEEKNEQMKTIILFKKGTISRIVLSNIKTNKKHFIPTWNEVSNYLFYLSLFPFGEPGGTRTHDTKLKRLVL